MGELDYSIAESLANIQDSLKGIESCLTDLIGFKEMELELMARKLNYSSLAVAKQAIKEGVF